MGDYFPEDYEDDFDFSEGMTGPGANKRNGPELPGMENFGDDAIMMGGIEQSEDIPAGMEFVPSSVPDGEIKCVFLNCCENIFFQNHLKNCVSNFSHLKKLHFSSVSNAPRAEAAQAMNS